MKKKMCAFIVFYVLLHALLVNFPDPSVFGDHNLPTHLRGRLHDDWLPGLQWMPRGWTTAGYNTPATMWLGNQNYWTYDPQKRLVPKPIPRDGEWQVSTIGVAPYVAATLWGMHIRIGGCRIDDVDWYLECPTIALHIHKPEQEVAHK